MCFPGAAAIAGGVVGVLKSVVQFGADTEDFNNRAKQWQTNRDNALETGRDEQRALTLRMIQEDRANTQKQEVTNIEEAQAISAAELSAASSGTGGISLNNLLVSLSRAATRKRVATEYNYFATVSQLTREIGATNTRAMNRINSVSKPSPPSPLGYILSGAGAVVGALPA